MIISTKKQRQTIHEFMIWKSNTILANSKTNLKLYTKIDSKDILKNFSDSEIHYIYFAFKYLPNPFLTTFSASSICPWCIKINACRQNCRQCEYGKRHFICNSCSYKSKISKWEKITEALNKKPKSTMFYLRINGLSEQLAKFK